MKTPIGIEKVSLSPEDASLGPYPSLGFVPIYDAELGNGDYYGLYWPLGKENNDPFVCDMLHDEGRLEVSFSSLGKFIEWLDLNDWERGEEEVEDPESPSVMFNKAKSFYSGSDVQPAIELLTLACSNFPEISEYWYALSSQLRRVGNIEKSAKAALKALNSNWVFGIPSQGTIQSLKSPQFIEVLDQDPIIQRISELSFGFGGVKENSNYPIMKECIQEYFSSEKFVDGLMLLQNYGYAMYSETVAFQERYNFDLSDWQKELSELCLKYLGSCRIYGK